MNCTRCVPSTCQEEEDLSVGVGTFCVTLLKNKYTSISFYEVYLSKVQVYFKYTLCKLSTLISMHYKYTVSVLLWTKLANFLMYKSILFSIL